MKKFFKNQGKEFFLLLASIILMCVPLFSCIYIFYTDSITWRVYVCIGVILIGFLASAKVYIKIQNESIDTFVNKLLTVLVGFNFLVFLCANTVITFPIMVCLNLSQHTRPFAFKILRLISTTACFILGVRVIERGVMYSEPCIFAPNHRGSIDYILANRYARKSMWKVIAGDNLIKFFPFSLFAGISCIFIEREDTLKNDAIERIYRMYKKLFGVKPLDKVFRVASTFLKKGYSIVVYFEGTRKRPWVNSLLVPKEETPQGTFLIALRNNIDIVPVAIYGADTYKEPLKGNPLKKKWYESKWWISPTKIYIHYCHAVRVKDDNGEYKDIETLMSEVRQKIEMKLKLNKAILD